jgi:hypothetical protein
MYLRISLPEVPAQKRLTHRSILQNLELNA